MALSDLPITWVRTRVVPEPLRAIIRCCTGGPPDLANSKCTRTQSPNGQIIEIVKLKGGLDGLAQQHLDRFIESFPIERI